MSNEREKRYAEAISEASGIAAHRPQVRKEARAVMAVADAEQAEWHRRALAAEEEDHRLTRLLEQRAAALTRTIDAKNAAEAQIAAIRDLSHTWDDKADDAEEHGYREAARATHFDAQKLRALLDGAR